MLPYLLLQRVRWPIVNSKLASWTLAFFILAALPADALAQESVKLRIYPVLNPELDDVNALSGTVKAENTVSFNGPYEQDEEGQAYKDVDLSFNNAALYLSVDAKLSTPFPYYALLPTQFKIWNLQSESPIPIALFLAKAGQIGDDDALAIEVGWLRERSPWSQTKTASIGEYYLRARQAAQYVLQTSSDPTADKNRFIAVFRYLQIVSVASQKIGLRDVNAKNATAWLEKFATKARNGDTSFKRAAGKALKDAEEIISMIGQMTAGMYQQIYDLTCSSETSCDPTPGACRIWENLQHHFQNDYVEADLGRYSGMLTRAVLDFSNCLGLALNRAKPAPELVNTADIGEAKLKAINQIKLIDLAARHCDDDLAKGKLQARKTEIEALTASLQASNAY